MNAALHECLNSPRVRSSVDKFAYRLAYQFPDTYDIEDGRQELWLEIIRKAGTAHSTLHMVKLAEDAVYSKYGRTTKRSSLQSSSDMVHCDEALSLHPSNDRSLELVEARATLDQIHDRIESMGKHKLSQVFALYRRDMRSKDIADELGISKGRVTQMRNEIAAIAMAM